MRGEVTNPLLEVRGECDYQMSCEICRGMLILTFNDMTHQFVEASRGELLLAAAA